MSKESLSSDDPHLGYTGCQVYRAQRVGRNHAVQIRGAILTLAEAIRLRQAGRDVVVCGEQGILNALLAQTIESRATNRCHKYHAAHVKHGSQALPHYQHRTRKNSGHMFYESPPEARVIQEDVNP